ncbi:MAG: hypothetical protein JWQ13_2301 [Ramlibacter sp.]|jgi:hypothetical protein|nr:hypothetical protein [Ramlibacter sp.]
MPGGSVLTEAIFVATVAAVAGAFAAASWKTIGVVLFVLLTLGTIVLALSPFGARLAAGISMAALVGYQAFRVPLEMALHALYSEGLIPVQMTYSGRNFDIVTGVLAVALARLPTFLLQAALFGHLLVFRTLRLSAPSAAAPQS